MIGRELKTRLHLLRPSLQNQVLDKQENMCERRKTKHHEVEQGQSVVVRDYRGKEMWIPTTISPKTGPVSYRVQVDPTTKWRRNANQIIES